MFSHRYIFFCLNEVYSDPPSQNKTSEKYLHYAQSIEIPHFLEWRSGPLFPSGPINEAGLYTGPVSIYVRSSRSGFRRVLFLAVYSSKLESDFVALLLEHIMETSVAVRPGLVLNSVVIASTHG